MDMELTWNGHRHGHGMDVEWTWNGRGIDVEWTWNGRGHIGKEWLLKE